MTDKKIEKILYKNPDGEIFDPEAAIMRHPTSAELTYTTWKARKARRRTPARSATTTPIR